MKRYRTNKKFELKEVAGELLLLPRGAETLDYNYVTVFNETGALIYRSMEEYTDVDTLAAILTEKYGIDSDEAKADVCAYVEKMLQEDMLEVE